MQQHLDNGCKSCAGLLQMWQGLHSIGQQEADYRPPDEAVRMAKAQFAAVAWKAESIVPSRLVFDTAVDATGAAFRGMASARQFLYEADQFFIDLWLEPQKGVDRISLIGQVLDRTKASRAAPGVAVRLLRGVLPVAHTATNQFGEFHLEFETGRDLSLAIGTDAERVIVLPLQSVPSGRAEGSTASGFPPTRSLR